MKLTYQEAATALHALHDHPSGAYRNDATAYAIRYTENTHIVPEWLEAFRPNAWKVYHAGRVYETHAVSEADAINNIRWNIYGRKAAGELPPFAAICPFNIIADAVGANRRALEAADRKSRTTEDLFGKRTISKSEALKRLARMTRNH